MSFNQKVILITGASSGIGADAARHFAKLGAKVAIVGRNGERLRAVAEEIKKSGSSSPLEIVADVTKDTARIVDETINHFGKLDVLINNAGVMGQDNAVDVNLDEFDRIFDTNLRSVIQLTKLCVPYLEKTKGNVVNVSSVAGLRGVPNFMSYAISKAALDQFTKCAAIDLAKKGIRVNSINPAVVRTPLFDTLNMPSEMINGYLEDCKNKYPLGRVGEVSDTSNALAHLTDNSKSSFLTGIILIVDGGSFVAGV